MISRRLLRIKVLQILYAFFTKKDMSIQQTEKELYYSVNKVEELFYFLFMTISEVKFLAEKKIEIRKTKLIASDEDKNPNLRFVQNKIILQLEKNQQYIDYLNENRISWADNPELLKKIHDKFVGSEMFDKYMSEEEQSYKNDKKIVRYFFSDVLYNCEDLYATLEEKSIYWNDDIDFVINSVELSLKMFHEYKPENIKFPPLYKKADDKEFVRDLLFKTIYKHKEIEKIISEQVVNWDFDRISFMDKLILTLAISEIIEFKTIPIKVTFNEYIDIAKRYGTERSPNFINGVLDKVTKHMLSEEMINKTGRGLIENKEE